MSGSLGCRCFDSWLIAGVLILWPVGAWGGLQTWTSGGPDGGPVVDLVFDPAASGTVYAATRHNGVFKSTDGGGTWAAANAGLPSAIVALAVAADGTLYALGDPTGVFKSNNGGASWQQTLNAPATAVAADPSAAGTVYVGTSNGTVFRTIDGGADWTESDEGLPEIRVLNLVVDPLTPVVVYLGSDLKAVYKSVDGGVSWTNKAQGIFGLAIESMVIDPLSPARLYVATASGMFKTANGSETWFSVGAQPPDTVDTLAIDPSLPTTLLAAAYGQIFRTTDRGASWSASSSTVPPAEILALAVDPTSSGTLYSGGASGVVKSVDSGVTWQETNAGLRAVRVERIVVDPVSPGTIYAASSESGIFKSIDVGASWASVNQGISKRAIVDLTLAPADPQMLYAAQGRGLRRSEDGGSSWTDPVSDPDVFGLLGPHVVSLASNPQEAATLLAVNAGFRSHMDPGPGVLRSTDAAISWERVYDPGDLVALTPGDVAFGPSDPSTAFFSFSGQAVFGLEPSRLFLFRSLDGGATWDEVFSQEGTGFAPLAVDPLSPSTVYAIASPGPDFEVLRTTNGGDDWTPLAVTAPCVLDLLPDPATPGKIWVACDPVYVSEDSGATWAPFDGTGLPSGGALQLGFDEGPPATLHVGTDTGVFSYELEAIDPAAIFSDGFESGDSSVWSSTVP